MSGFVILSVLFRVCRGTGAELELEVLKVESLNK
jgi:hypothetical protein